MTPRNSIVALVFLVACSKDSAPPSGSGTPGAPAAAAKGGSSGASGDRTAAPGLPGAADLAAQSAEVSEIGALMKRPLTSADVDRYLAIEAELAPHKSGLQDPKAVAAYQDLADAAAKKHGLSGSLEHNTISARLKAATMHIEYKIADDKLDEIQRGDRDAVQGRLADLKGKI